MIALIIALMLLFLAASWFRYVDVGQVLPTFRSFSTATTLTAIDHTVVFSGTKPVTATLPDARLCEGRFYSISNSSNAIPTPTLSIAPKTLQNIDGESIFSLPLSGQSILLMSDGANWRVLTEFIPSVSSSRKIADVSVSYVNGSDVVNHAANFYEISVN